MAYLALRSGNEVRIQSLRLAAYRRKAVMAGTTSIVDPFMAHGSAGESRGGVTGRAVEAGRNVLRMHAASRHSMAGGAIIHDAGVIESGRNKARRRMTYSAILAGGNMIRPFTGGKSGVVTGGAVVNNAGVIKDRRQETRCDMTVDAVQRGWHVSIELPRGSYSVVAGRAASRDALVIEVRIGKRRGRMADGAVLARRNMRRIDLRAFAGCIDTVVAGSAVARNP